MATMLAAVLYDVDDIRVEEREIPDIGANEILVQTRASGICTGDVMPWYVRRKAPLVLGHEPAGVVCAVGEGVECFSIGDRVFVHHHAPCFACALCERQDYVQCATWRKTAIDPGGLAEYFRVPQANLADTLPLPPHVSFVAGSLVEPLACVVKSIRRSGLRMGDHLHVIGLGVMGLMHAMVAQALGADVSGSDVLDHRRAHAQARGIRCPRAGENVAADVVICGPGSPQALQSALSCVRPGGAVVLFTPFEPGVPLAVDAHQFYFRDVKLVASYSCGPNDTQEALDLIGRNVVSPERLGVETYTLHDAARAYQALREMRILKPIVAIDGSV